MAKTEYLTLTEAQKAFRVSAPTLRAAIRAGLIPVLRLGARTIRIPRAALTGQSPLEKTRRRRRSRGQGRPS